MTNKLKSRLREYLHAKGLDPGGNGCIHCLWHEDKNASCKVNDEYVYCFACNESGDIYRVAAALIGVPCDKEHFREIAADVERALGIPEWQPPARPMRGSGRFKLSVSAVYRSELLKDFAKAIDTDNMERAYYLACLLLALFMLPEAQP